MRVRLGEWIRILVARPTLHVVLSGLVATGHSRESQPRECTPLRLESAGEAVAGARGGKHVRAAPVAARRTVSRGSPDATLNGVLLEEPSVTPHVADGAANGEATEQRAPGIHPGVEPPRIAAKNAHLASLTRAGISRDPERSAGDGEAAGIAATLTEWARLLERIPGVDRRRHTLSHRDDGDVAIRDRCSRGGIGAVAVVVRRIRGDVVRATSLGPTAPPRPSRSSAPRRYDERAARGGGAVGGRRRTSGEDVDALDLLGREVVQPRASHAGDASQHLRRWNADTVHDHQRFGVPEDARGPPQSHARALVRVAARARDAQPCDAAAKQFGESTRMRDRQARRVDRGDRGTDRARGREERRCHGNRPLEVRAERAGAVGARLRQRCGRK